MNQELNRTVKGHRSSSILESLDTQVVSEAARRESRNREVHLPPLSVFRWWARRTAAVNDAILQSAENVLGPSPLLVLDPFAGGGTIPLVALRAGHRVHAQDLNPWATQGIECMLRLPPAEEIAKAVTRLGELASPLLADAYGTKMSDGTPGELVHTYRVAVGSCGECDRTQRLFPYSLLTLKSRKERKRPEAVFGCRCGHVFEGRVDQESKCDSCGRLVDPAAIYTPRRIVECIHCGSRERLSERAARHGWSWEVVMVERTDGTLREFGLPSPAELDQATRRYPGLRSLGEIPQGSETRVLLRHGFRFWQDLFPERQRYVTEELLKLIGDAGESSELTACLRTALVGTTEFAGHLSRWDRFYLKCNDATAGHRFNFSTFVPELNVWGVGRLGRGTFSRRAKSMEKASIWLESSIGRRPTVAGIAADFPGETDALVVTGDSSSIPSPPERFDLVLTDPPYHDDVQYGELSLFFRSWAGLSLESLDGEAVSNSATGVNVAHADYSNALTPIFAECKRVLRPEGRIVFSYANRDPEAWLALFQALQNAGLFAVACAVVHSENETDFKKRGVRSCNDDLLLELSPTQLTIPAPSTAATEYDPFIAAVASTFLKVGSLGGNWRPKALSYLRAAASDSPSFGQRS